MFHYAQTFRYISRLCQRLLVVLILISLSGCASALAGQGNADDVSGPLLVWHSWPDPESQIIDNLLQDFMQIHPRVTIVSEYIPSNELDAEFVSQMAAGLGPDMIIGAELKFIHELVEQDLLLSLSASDIITTMLLSHAVQALVVDEHLYGLPFAAYTSVLFYNRSLVEQPATTIEELLEESKAGLAVALPTDFYHAYWGVRAFGGELIDEQGTVVVDDKVVEWLQWLVNAQKEGVFLSSNYGELRDFFAEGNAAYFVGDSSDMPHLQQTLGEDMVGIAILPHRAIEDSEELSVEDRLLRQMSPGAFLELEVMSISKISAQKELALKVIEFFVNQTHQREIAQADLGQIPVNRSVRIDPRFSPNESTLIRQSANGVIIPLKDISVEEALIAVGSDVFNQVLEGVILPADAVALIRDGVDEKLQAAQASRE